MKGTFLSTPYSLEAFIEESREKGVHGGTFEKESERMLRIDVDGGVWLRPGAAVAYRGDIAFERLPTVRAGSMEDAALRELTPLVRAVGVGRLYCGYHAAQVRLLQLSGETIFVKWGELLAFEPSLEFVTTFVRHRVGLASGGLVAVKLTGHGTLAIATHGEPLTLDVRPGEPVSSDPHATLAWSGTLTPSLKTDLTWRSAIGHGGQEPVQMFFEGTGFVVVQPHKDPNRMASKITVKNLIKSLLAL
jgi:uncharacterized protein (AIM24 family)